MKEITIRQARTEDKDAVLKANGSVYEGRDFLPAYYDHFLASPDMFAAVMLHGIQLIAFEVGQLIDDGETIVTRGGRIHPEFEGKGLIKRLSMFMLQWGISKGASRIVFTITDASVHLPKKSFKEMTKFILTKQVPLYHVIGKELIFSQKDITDSSSLVTVSDIQMSQYFRSQAIREYLSNQGRMIVDGVPYRMISANIQAMREPKAFTTIYSNIKHSDGVCAGLLSFGLVCPIPKPEYKYVIDLFGTDHSSLRTHIMRHLLRLKEKTKGVTALLVFVPMEFDIQYLDAVLERFGVSRQPYVSKDPKLNTRQVYAYEGAERYNSKL